MDDFEGESVWRLADIEVNSAKTEVCDCKRKINLISINQLNYKASEKSLATEELVG